MEHIIAKKKRRSKKTNSTTMNNNFKVAIQRKWNFVEPFFRRRIKTIAFYSFSFLVNRNSFSRKIEIELVANEKMADAHKAALKTKAKIKFVHM